MTAGEAKAASADGHEFNTHLVEDASSDLYVARVFCEVTETSINSLRDLMKETNAGPWVLGQLSEIDTMLFEIKDKMGIAKEKIDKSVDEHFAARRAEKKAS